MKLISTFKKSVIISILINAAGKGLYFINILFINNLIGATVKTDIYFFCLNFITLLTGFAIYINNDVIAPEIIRIREKENVKSVFTFLNNYLFWMLAIGLIFSFLFFFFPSIITNFFSDFKEDIIYQNSELISLFGILLILILIVNVFTMVLTSYNYYTAPMKANFINNLLIFLFLLLLHSSIGIYAAIIGAILGYLLNSIYLLYFSITQIGLHFSVVNFKIPKNILKNIFLVSSSYGIYFLYMVFANFYISGFGTGVQTAINTGQQIALAPYQLIAFQLLSIVLIKLCDAVNQENKSLFFNTYKKTLKALLFFLVPVCLFIFYFSNSICTFLLKLSGNLDKEYIETVGLVLGLIALSVPFNAIYVLNTKVLIAKQKIKQLFTLNLIVYLTFFICIYFGIKIDNLKGYLYANLLANILSVLVYIPALKKEFKLENYSKKIEISHHKSKQS